MQADPNNKALDAFKAWIGELACPACLGALRLGEDTVTCTACGRIYPLVEGIPVLIMERAEQEN
jgi:uncharacterized protein YbaR (Trm112 family)